MKKIIITCFLMLALFSFVKAQEYKKMMDDPNANFYDIQNEFYKYWEAKKSALNENTDNKKEEEMEGEYFQFKRWEWFMENRVYPSGKLINPAAKAFEAWQTEKKELDDNSNKIQAVNGFWNSAGANGFDYNSCNGLGLGIGRVNCVAFDPINSNIIYCGTPSGGLWKNYYAGVGTWFPLTDGIPQIGVSGIAINPNNTNQIYILTGDGETGNAKSIGVLKTDNGGLTWFSTGLTFTVTQNVVGRKLLMDPTNSNILFAITSAGIYKTTNGGSNWALVKSGSFFDCEFNPNNHNVLYACNSTQYFRSSNNGQNWSQLGNSNLPTAPGSIRTCLGVSAYYPAYVYLLYANNNFIGLYCSTDTGKTFVLKSSSPDIIGNQGAYNLVLAVDPFNANNVYAGGLSIFQSADGGINWFSTPDTHVDQHGLEFSGGNLYSTNDGGIYVSANGAGTFTRITDGMEITQIYCIEGTPQNSDLLLYGSQDNGTNKFDDGTNIIKAVFGGDGVNCHIDYTNSNIMYAACQNGSFLVKSTDGGCNWNSIAVSDSGGSWQLPFIMSPVNPSVLYAGYKSIFKTVDGGAHWDTILYHVGNQNAMAMGTNNPDVVYSVQGGNIVRKTTDGGANWSIVTNNLPVSTALINWIAVSTIDANMVWVTFSGYSNGNKVWFSPSGGATWYNISGSLPNVPVQCISFEPGSSIDALYIGTDIGVYYRDNNLGYWIPYRNGLPNVMVKSLYINVNANKISAGTYGRGIWTSDLYSSCVSDYYLTPANNPGSGGFQRYTCSNNLESTRQYLGGIGTDVKYNAGNEIILHPDFIFSGTGGALFYAYISGCPPPSSAPYNPLAGIWAGNMNSNINNDEAPGYSSEGNTKENILNNEVLLYPNPFNSKVEMTLYSDQIEKGKINFYNVMGSKAKKTVNKTFTKGLNKITLELNDFAPGVYMIEIYNGNTKTVKRIIKN